MDPSTRRLDLDDDSITENTRGAYPLTSIPNHVPDKRGGHPSTIVMLTADAFGVLPPVARLTPEEAMTMFLAGYTAKVAGTEVGVVEPQAAFSACFGAPFLPQPPAVYAELLARADPPPRGERLARQHRLDRRGVRDRLADADRRDPGDRARGGVRRARLRPDPPRPDLRLPGPDGGPGRGRRPARPRGTWADAAAYDAAASDLAAKIQEHAADMTS